MKLVLKIIYNFLFLLICTQSIAQKTYFTHNGFMVIKAYDSDSLKSYKFDNIVVLLDYEKATVDMSFKLDDSLDDIVPSNRFFSDHDAKITTSLSIPKIETQPHPDWYFSTNGELYFDEKAYYLAGEGELKHHDGSEILACYLMLKLEPTEGFDLVMETIGKVHELHLFQTVLSHVVIDGNNH